MKIGLGTVQFGLDYGISNPNGKTDEDEVARILLFAQQTGIQLIDTASGYGDSEEVLGRTLPEQNYFRLVTKTPVFSQHGITSVDANILEESFRRSLEKLRLTSVYALMVHRADDLISEGSSLLMNRMHQLKEAGLIEKIGVSVYNAEQIDRILDQYSIDLIQVPVNVLDQRLLVSGHLAKLKAAGVEIHARSTFLQGVLLMEPDSLSQQFASAKPVLRHYHEFLQSLGLIAVEGSLGFVLGVPEVDAVICGVNTQQQLAEICKVMPLDINEFSCFACNDETVLNPSHWRFK